MATINLAGTGISGGGGSIGILLTPDFLSGDGYSGAWGSASLAPVQPQRNLQGSSGGTGTATAQLILGPSGQGFSESSGVALAGLPRSLSGTGASSSSGHAEMGALISLAGSGASVSYGLAGNLRPVPLLFIGTGFGGGFGEGEWVFLMPPLRPPEIGEMAGAINLVPNPSLENADKGLADWASNLSTMALSSARAKEGNNSAHVIFTNGQTNSNASVRSQRNLFVTGDVHRYAGSIHLNGTVTLIYLLLRATYTDGSTQDVFDATDGTFSLVTGTDEWVRAFTPVLVADPNKILNYLQVFVWQPTAIGEDVYLDAAMIEDITDSGAASEYVDGDMPNSYWTGVKGYSVSVREPVAVS